MTRSLPLVSICVPTYNSSRYLRQTLDSLVAQSYGNLEVIISDNASQDDSVEIAQEYSRRYGFRVLVNETNSGPFQNWNNLIAEARGEYVALYHSDDIYEPDIVHKCVGLLESDPELGLVGTLATIVDENGVKISATELPSGNGPGGRYRLADAFRAVVRSGGSRYFLVTPSVMVRRRLYDELGGFDISGRFGSAGDYEMWLRIAAHCPVAVLPEYLMKYRVHSAQGSEQELRRNVALPDILEVLAAHAPAIQAGELLDEYCRYRARAIFKTALKQNCRGEFERSRETAAQVGAGRYRVAALGLMAASLVRVNLALWPGRPWPCRIAREKA